MATNHPTKPIRILMLHGYTQSGPLFRAKTRALEKHLQKAFPTGITLTYPTAPIQLHTADFPNDNNNDRQAQQEGTEAEPYAWAWWRRKDGTNSVFAGGTDKNAYTYDGIEIGLAHIAEVLKSEGPFDGAIGFSQGGALAGMLAALLEPGRRETFEERRGDGGMKFPQSFIASGTQLSTGQGEQQVNSVHIAENGVDAVDNRVKHEQAPLVHPPLRFAVIYSGFAPTSHPCYSSFYNPKIRTPVLHFIGSVDTVVAEHRSLEAVHVCEAIDERKRLVYHPGGHFLPSSQKQYVAPLISFIREIMNSESSVNNANRHSEEKVEDMDTPF